MKPSRLLRTVVGVGPGGAVQAAVGAGGANGAGSVGGTAQRSGRATASPIWAVAAPRASDAPATSSRARRLVSDAAPRVAWDRKPIPTSPSQTSYVDGAGSRGVGQRLNV